MLDEEVNFVGMADLDADLAQTNAESIRSYSEVSKGYTVFGDGDVLVAKITPCFENNKIGQAQLRRKVGVGSTEFHVVRPMEDLHDRYLLHFLRQDRVRRQGESRMTGSAGQRRVPAEFLQALEIPLPPVDEQRRIATILDCADSIRVKCRRSLQQLDDLTRSAFTAAFGNPMAVGPNHRQLGEVAEVVTGNTPSRDVGENFGQGIEWIKSDNLGGVIATQAEEELSPSGEERARTVPPG